MQRALASTAFEGSWLHPPLDTLLHVNAPRPELFAAAALTRHRRAAVVRGPLV